MEVDFLSKEWRYRGATRVDPDSSSGTVGLLLVESMPAVMRC